MTPSRPTPTCFSRRVLTIVMTIAVFVGGFLALTPDGSLDDNTLLAQAAKKGSSKKKNRTAVENPFPGRPLAPPLDGGVAWLNTGGEISLKDLRGKIVVLDFWTYCCINCMHVLPDLEYLEKKYAKELVVIGVHSAKFDNEKDSEAIRKAIVRYEIEHPVINDAHMKVWRNFQISSWPTLVLIDPEGRYVGQQPGEGNRELFDKVIGMLVDYHGKKGTLDRTPVRFDLERNRQEPRPLKFPGKVLADLSGGRLFISDSNHNRIVVTGLDGTLQEVIGNGAAGRTNGTYARASFDHPQGTALVGDRLFVADTENHMIRVVDLKRKTVRSLIGTGRQARFGNRGGSLKNTALNSPWALSQVGGVLYIAMAGPHQVWSHKLGSSTVGIYAGSGREDITDGPLARSALAQPAALASDGIHLCVADSEGAAIRQIDTDPGGEVKTIVGSHDLPRGRALFEFGDIDGVGDKVRLQHPLGVAYHAGVLYVADTYNHKIKRVELKTKKTTSFLGSKRGTTTEPARFSEPAGVSVGGGKLYIADTNNHRICVADLKTGKVEELKIAGLEPPTPIEPTDVGFDRTGRSVVLPTQSIKTGPAMTLTLPLAIPKGFKLNPRASIIFRATGAKSQKVVANRDLGKRRKAKPTGPSSATASLALTGQAGKATIEVAVSYQVCRDGIGGLCKLLTSRWTIPLTAGDDGKTTSVILPPSTRPKTK